MELFKCVSGMYSAWNAEPHRTDQRFFHVTPWSAMERRKCSVPGRKKI